VAASRELCLDPADHLLAADLLGGVDTTRRPTSTALSRSPVASSIRACIPLTSIPDAVRGDGYKPS
jgi:hypothetical protein